MVTAISRFSGLEHIWALGTNVWLGVVVFVQSLHKLLGTLCFYLLVKVMYVHINLRTLCEVSFVGEGTC